MMEAKSVKIPAIFLFLVINFYAECTSGPDNLGTEYIVAFFDIYHEPGSPNSPTDPELYIATLENTDVSATVRAPVWNGGTWSTTVTVTRGTSQKVQIPESSRVYGSGIIHNSFLIESDGPIGVQLLKRLVHVTLIYKAMNKEAYNMDGYTLYPIDTLGKEYYVATGFYGCWLVIAVEPGTTTITAQATERITVLGTQYNAGTDIVITLAQYQQWQYCYTANTNGDLTGSHFVADKNVAAFSGSYYCGIPTGGTVDHILTQLVPVESYGKQFAAIGAPNRAVGDWFLVVVAEEWTEIFLDGATNRDTRLRNPGDSKIYDWASGSFHTIRTDKPAAVYHFAKSYDYVSESADGGDPSLAYLPPMEQWANQHLYTTMEGHPTSGDFNHYARVVIDKTRKDGILLNDAPLPTGTVWTDLPDWNLATTQLSLAEGVYDFYHIDPSVTFLLMEFGNVQWGSYGTPAGSRMAPINTVCSTTTTVPGDIIDNDCDGWIDEELPDGLDNDGDGSIDEDLAAEPRVDGGWGNWTDWSGCNCDVANYQFRNRSCDNPEPSGKGKYCVGPEINTIDCTECSETTPGETTTTTTTLQPTTTTTPELTSTTTTTPEPATTATTTPEPTTTTTTTPEPTTTATTTPELTSTTSTTLELTTTTTTTLELTSTTTTTLEPTTTTTITPEPTTTTTREPTTTTTTTPETTTTSTTTTEPTTPTTTTTEPTTTTTTAPEPTTTTTPEPTTTTATTPEQTTTTTAATEPTKTTTTTLEPTTTTTTTLESTTTTTTDPTTTTTTTIQPTTTTTETLEPTTTTTTTTKPTTTTITTLEPTTTSTITTEPTTTRSTTPEPTTTTTTTPEPTTTKTTTPDPTTTTTTTTEPTTTTITTLEPTTTTTTTPEPTTTKITTPDPTTTTTTSLEPTATTTTEPTMTTTTTTTTTTPEQTTTSNTIPDTTTATTIQPTTTTTLEPTTTTTTTTEPTMTTTTTTEPITTMTTQTMTTTITSTNSIEPTTIVTLTPEPTTTEEPTTTTTTAIQSTTTITTTLEPTTTITATPEATIRTQSPSTSYASTRLDWTSQSLSTSIIGETKKPKKYKKRSTTPIPPTRKKVFGKLRKLGWPTTTEESTTLAEIPATPFDWIPLVATLAIIGLGTIVSCIIYAGCRRRRRRKGKSRVHSADHPRSSYSRARLVGTAHS